MDMISAAEILIFSGGSGILLSFAIGFMMRMPLQPWGREWFNGIDFHRSAQRIRTGLCWV
jgi:hypothetical protein